MGKLGSGLKLWIIGAAVLLAAGRSGPAAPEVRDKIGRILENPLLESARVAVRAEYLKTHEEIFSWNAKAPMIPASNLKLLTSGCALLDLGPEFRFLTTVSAAPLDPRTGAVRGNLVLRGGGDPTWDTDFYPSSTAPLVILAQQLKKAGVSTVDGDVVVDDSLFDRKFTGNGWKARYEWEDYASEVAAASLNRNKAVVSIFPDAPGHHARIGVSPPNHVLKIVNHVITARGGTDIRINRNRAGNLMILSGVINRRHPVITIPFNINNPPLFVASVFRQVLKAQGIRVRGRAREIRGGESRQYASYTSLAGIQSPALSAIVHRMDKESDNFLAEHLFRALGARAYGKGTVTNGQRAVSSCLGSLGLRGTPLTMDDGSGLSDKDRVSALTLVRLLEGMAALPLGEDLKNALPRGGVDGTLEDRLKDVQIQAKTGALRGVNSLSGYLINRAGRTVVFSIIINNFHASSETARDLIDSIVRALAETGSSA